MVLRDGFPSATGVADALDLRLDLAGLVVKDTSGNPRTGVFMRHTNALVSSTATMNSSVAAFEACVSRSSQGAIFIANDGATNVLHPNAPVSGSRYDIVYVKQNDAVSPNADANSNPVFGILSGPASGSPTAYTYATAKAALASGAPGAGAEPLAMVLIPSTATTTQSGGVVYTQLFRYTAAEGSSCPVRNLTDRGDFTWRKGQTVYDLATDIEWAYDGSTWNAPYGSFLGRAVRSSNTPTVQNASFTDLSTTANWSTTSTAGQVKNFAAYSNGWTIPASGVYEVSYALSSSGNIGLLVGITINDSSVVVGDLRLSDSVNPVQSVAATTVTGQMYFTAGDVIRLYAIAASGTPTLAGSVGHFSITWVRAA